MDKNEFIDAVAKQKGISRGKAYRSVEAVMDTIRILIMQGEEIKIGGFGTFDIVTDLKGERIPVFKAGRALKKVATEARKTLEHFFQKSIYLETFVKVDKDWRSSDKELKNFGYQMD